MLVTSSNQLKNHLNKMTSVALGSFDALHKGHLQVIKKAISFARENDLLSLVQIFDSPFFKEAINPLQKRIDILKELGADIVVIESFDKKFKQTNYQDFVLKYLKNLYNSNTVFSGENYRFGCNAQGDVMLLAEECSKHGIQSRVVESVSLDGIISSTKIREFIKEGQMEKTIEYMSRPYSVRGTVVHGNAIGRKLGFPTANLNIPPEQLSPKDGVYLSRILWEDKIFLGITNIGSKPTIDETVRNIETFISDFKGDLYGQEIEVEFLKRIRDIKRFESLDLLKNQLESDKKFIFEI